MRAQIGEVTERLNVPVSKTGISASVSWVRIPPSPPTPLGANDTQRFSRVGLELRGKSSRWAFHSLPKKRQRSPVRDAASDSASRHLIRSAGSEGCVTTPRNSQNALNVMEKPVCVNDERIARRRPT